MTQKMTIDIWTDLMCPFCFIGKKNFEAAFAQFPERDNISIKWHSYRLEPDFHPRAKKNAHKIFAEYKKIPIDKARELNNYVIQMAAKTGITFDMENLQWADTLMAHRLLQWARQYRLAEQLEQRLFEAVFCNGENIGSNDTLLAIANEAGLPLREAKAILNSTAYTEEVRQDIRQSQSLGLRGVPFFLVDNKITFSGAVQPNDFLSVLTESFANWKAENPQSVSLDGESCGIDGICE